MVNENFLRKARQDLSALSYLKWSFQSQKIILYRNSRVDLMEGQVIQID